MVFRRADSEEAVGHRPIVVLLTLCGLSLLGLACGTNGGDGVDSAAGGDCCPGGFGGPALRISSSVFWSIEGCRLSAMRFLSDNLASGFTFGGGVCMSGGMSR